MPPEPSRTGRDVTEGMPPTGGPGPSQPSAPRLPSPIGVPDDFFAEGPQRDYGYEQRGPDGRLVYQPLMAQPRVKPSYYEGDEIAFLYGMTASEIAAVQRQLVAAGLLDPDSFVPGIAGGGNDPTLIAVQNVMSYANRAGFTSFDDALRQLVSAGPTAEFTDATSGRGGTGRLPAPVSNADDLRRVFKAAVIDTLGTGWSEEQINAMVADYQAHERAYNNTIAAGEAPDEQIASAETFALQQAQQADPTGVQAQQFVSAGNDLLDMIGRWSG